MPIKWIETVIEEPKMVPSNENWTDYVFLGLGSIRNELLQQPLGLQDIYPMIRDKEGYKFAIYPYPLSTAPKYWTTDISILPINITL